MAKPVFKVISHVTVPVMKLDTTRPNYLRFEEAIHLAPEGDKQKAAREAAIAAGKQVKPVPEVCKVVDLMTGEYAQIVANEVLKSELRQNYPDDSYVGRSFRINKFAPNGDKNYATFQIAEVEVSMPESDDDGEESLQTEIAVEHYEQIGETAEPELSHIPGETSEPEPEMAAAGAASGGNRRRGK